MNRILKGDIFLQFPKLVQDANDPEWRAFADEINALRDQMVSDPLPDEGAIETIGLLYDPDRTPAITFDYLAQFFAVEFYEDDTDTLRRRRLLRAVRRHRLYGTLQYVYDEVLERFGFPILFFTSSFVYVFNEADNPAISDPVILWGEQLPTGAVSWKEFKDNRLVVSIGNAVLSPQQLDALYSFLAASKAANAVLYVIDAANTLLKVIYSTDLSIVAQPNNIDPEI